VTLPRGAATSGAIEIVGYGDPLPHVQRTGTAQVTTLEALHLVSAGPAFTCEGDSGGPALAGGAIVGVTSSGDCATVSRHTRVDVDAAFIDATIAATAPSAGAPGDRCYYDANCADGVACVAATDEPSRAFCAPACTTSCDSDLICVDGLCRHPLPSPGAEGGTCDVAADCARNPCVARKGDDDAICARRCFSDLPGFACPTGTKCLPADDGGEACFAPNSGGCSAAPSPALFALLALLQLLRGRGRP
jgi:Trypsin